MHACLEATIVHDDAPTREWRVTEDLSGVLDTPAHWPTGSRALRTVGDYQLLRKIGKGGMAQVWMARKATLEGASKAAAVKLLLGNLADDPTYREMFYDEARLTMLLSHSNIVQVFDAGLSDGQCYLAMEWVDGVNLAQLSQWMREMGHTLSLSAVGFIVGEVLHALAYAHSLSHDGQSLCIVHRDVSPQNVLVSVSGEVKLVDFGVARLAKEETSGIHVRGKLRYMSPEQLSGSSRQPTVDLFAVGALLHELLEGRKFRDCTDERVLYGEVLSGSIPPLARQGVPRELDQLRLALLEADPGRRIQSAELGLERLHRWTGYRTASLEISRFARSLVGVTGPRSGVHVAERSSGAWAEVRPDSSPSPRRPSGSENNKWQAEGTVTNLHLRTPSFTNDVTRQAEVSSNHGGEQRRSWSSRHGVVFATGTLALLVLFVALSSGRDARKDEDGWGGEPTWVASGGLQARKIADVRDHSPIEETSDLIYDLPKKASFVDPDRARLRTANLAVTAIDGLTEATDQIVSKSKSKSKSKLKLKLGEFRYVEIKIGRRVRELENNQQVLDVSPGSYLVKIRVGRKDPWKSVGRLRVRPGNDYELTFLKSSTFTVKKSRSR